MLGLIASGDPRFAAIAAEGARTIPGRENGGNCDIKNLTRGCRVYFPVFVEGANLSMGDIHFSQVRALGARERAAGARRRRRRCWSLA